MAALGEGGTGRCVCVCVCVCVCARARVLLAAILGMETTPTPSRPLEELGTTNNAAC